MSSLKMTFSLASLVLIIFCIACYRCHWRWQHLDGGPTVSITKYSGKVLDTDGAPTAADYKATRADFKVKITFSHGVAAPSCCK